ncbi:hypothetical protein GCM10027046_14000 [Uliginosibacterium flavum]
MRIQRLAVIQTHTQQAAHGYERIEKHLDGTGQRQARAQHAAEFLSFQICKHSQTQVLVVRFLFDESARKNAIPGFK